MFAVILVFPGFAAAISITGDYLPHVSFDPEMNRYLAVYANFDAVGTESVYGRFVNSDGTAGDGFAIATGSDTVDYYDASSVFDPVNRKFLVVFKKYAFTESINGDIWGQFVSQSGTLIGSNFPICENVGNIQRNPFAAFDNKNQRYFVVWVDHRNTNPDIYGQLLDKDGNKILADDLNITETGVDQSFGTVTYVDSKEAYVAAWMDTTNNENFARLIDKNGAFTGSVFQVTAGGTAYQSGPQLAWDNADSRLMSVWQDNRDGYVYGRLIDLDAPTIGSNSPISSVDGIYKDEPQVAFNSGSGIYLTAYLAESQLPPVLKLGAKSPMGVTSMDIYGRYITATGETSGDQFKILEDSRSQYGLSIAANPNCSNFLAATSSVNPDDNLSYLQLTVIGDPCSNAPSAPLLSSPTNGATGLGSSVTLKWKESEDPDKDEVSYDVILCDNENLSGCEGTTVASIAKHDEFYAMAGITGLPALLLALFVLGSSKQRRKAYLLLTLLILTGVAAIQLSCSSSGPSYKATGLNPGSTYYWKVLASDGKGGVSSSETWNFTTK
jgi:hypothetical protein